MNILLAITNFSQLTGSEIYTYELACGLTRRGHKVTIMANQVGGEIADRARQRGVQTVRFFEEDIKPDIIHSAQPSPTSYVLSNFSTPIVSTIHSHLVYERPIIDKRIRKYICIRPEIKKKIVTEDGIDEEKTTVIYNGVDTTRFNKQNTHDGGYILFVGTMDHLRRGVVQELILRSEKEKLALMVVSPSFKESDTRPDGLPKHVRFVEGMWDIESVTKDCTMTASIYLGRTTIEGWMCGKQGLIYDVDDQGRIKDIGVADVPESDVLKQFDIDTMTEKIEDVYREAIK